MNNNLLPFRIRNFGCHKKIQNRHIRVVGAVLEVLREMKCLARSS